MFDSSAQPTGFYEWLQAAACGKEGDLCCTGSDQATGETWDAPTSASVLLQLLDNFDVHTVRQFVSLRCECSPCIGATPTAPQDMRSEEQWVAAILTGYAGWLCCYTDPDRFGKLHFLWRQQGTTRAINVVRAACTACSVTPPAPPPPGPPLPPPPQPVACKSPMVAVRTSMDLANSLLPTSTSMPARNLVPGSIEEEF